MHPLGMILLWSVVVRRGWFISDTLGAMKRAASWEHGRIAEAGRRGTKK